MTDGCTRHWIPAGKWRGSAGRRAFGIVFVIAASTAPSTATLAQSALDGQWRLARHRYESAVEISFQGSQLRATIGCLDVDYRVEMSGSTFSASGDVVRQAPCRLAEMRNPAAHRYWQRVEARIADANHFEVRGDRLVLTGPSGKLTFERKR